MPCPHDTTPDHPTHVICRLVRDELGFRAQHNRRACARCERDAQKGLVAEIIAVNLKARVSRLWHYDEKYPGRVTVPLAEATRRLKVRLGVHVAADALVEAVDRGLPLDRAAPCAHVISEPTNGVDRAPPGGA